MRVAGLHVEGFGILRDWRVDDLGAGLSVFYGPNEAGKSTLLAFLRGVLFGFPDGRSKEPKYEPASGDAHGGRITLVGSNGPVVVERFAGAGRRLTLTLEDGAPGDAADLAERLGHADARLFRDVYAFGLTELQQLGALGDAAVQDHLLAAGVTGAGRSARRALRELHGAATELFAGVRSRKSDRARAIATEISSLRSQLLLRQEAALRYPDLVEAERGIALQLTALGAESLRARAQEQRARRLLELWAELFSPLSDTREQLSKLGPMRALGDDTGERLDRALGALEAARERRDQVRA